MHALAGLVQARADGFLGAGLLSRANWAEASRAVGGGMHMEEGGEAVVAVDVHGRPPAQTQLGIAEPRNLDAAAPPNAPYP